MRQALRVLRKTSITAGLAAAALVAATVAPAAAVEAGAGAGTGWEYPTNGDFCVFPAVVAAELTAENFQLNYLAGTLASVDGLAAYAGPVDMSIDVAAHVVSPVGTHGNGSCPGSFPVPGLVDITDASVTSPGGEVSCDLISGLTPNTYIRVDTTVAFTFNAECDITGNLPVADGTVTNAPMTFVVEGNMVFCDIPPFGIPNPVCDVLGRPADAGSHLVVAYEAVGLTLQS